MVEMTGIGIYVPKPNSLMGRVANSQSVASSHLGCAALV